MDWDEARLLPAALSLGVGGIAALMLALGAAVEASPLAPLLLAGAIVLLAASRALEPGRRWSLLLGSRAAVLGVVVWLAVAAVTHDADRPMQSVFGLGFAGASLWVARFLAAETRPPPWASWDWDDRGEPAAPPAHRDEDGWIEELPAAPIRPMTGRDSSELRRRPPPAASAGAGEGQNQRLVTIFFEV